MTSLYRSCLLLFVCAGGRILSYITIATNTLQSMAATPSNTTGSNDATTPVDLKTLNNQLLHHSFLPPTCNCRAPPLCPSDSHGITQHDIDTWHALPHRPDIQHYPSATRWYDHVARYMSTHRHSSSTTVVNGEHKQQQQRAAKPPKTTPKDSSSSSSNASAKKSNAASNNKPGAKKGGKPGMAAAKEEKHAIIPIPMIDIGANLLDDMFNGNYHGSNHHVPDMDHVIKRALAVGLTHIIVTAGSLSEAKLALPFTQRASQLYCTVGVHPTRANEFEANPTEYYQQLLAVAREGRAAGKIVAIGECGLDYDRLQFCSKEVQLRHFQCHFDLAQATGLPMFLHNRASTQDFAEQVRTHRHKFKYGVVHSFDGSEEEVKQLLALDLFIGINGNHSAVCLLDSFIHFNDLGHRLFIKDGSEYQNNVYHSI
jgi:Tat protein secretion system quality control protein TatD with DNase activity